VIRRAALMLTLLIGLAGCGDPTAEQLPAVEVEPMAGGTEISLADIDGPAVVNLWATWCAPCLREMPEFEAVYQERAGAVQFVGVNVGEARSQAAEFIDQLGITYPQYLDSEGRVATALEASTMPVTVVIDRDGTVVEHHLGEMSRDQLEAAIDRATDS
jgi:thiol-disulfide isomerase/thioredoxin